MTTCRGCELHSDTIPLSLLPPSSPVCLCLNLPTFWGRWDKPQQSWHHAQASVLPLQVSYGDPGFQVTNLGFSSVWPCNPKGREKAYHESLITYTLGEKYHYGNTEALGWSLFWPLPRVALFCGIRDDPRMAWVRLLSGNEWSWNKMDNRFCFPLFTPARGSFGKIAVVVLAPS